MSDVAVIIVAAGKSTRFNDKKDKKPFVSVNARALWLHSVDRFIQRDDVKQLILVIAEDDQQIFDERFRAEATILDVEVVYGGDSRAESVWNGLKTVDEDIHLVVVHDAARPCIAEVWLDELFERAKQTGAAILGTPVVSTVKRVTVDGVCETISRDGLWESQTPQMFDKSKLLQAFKTAQDYTAATDEAQLMEWAGHTVSLVSASPLNRKVTTQEDLKFIEFAIQALPKRRLDGPAGSDSSSPLENSDFWK